MWKKFFGFLFSACLMFNVVHAQSQNFEIDGDHGKLSAVLQTPDNQKNFPLVIICHGFTGNKNEKLLTTIADDLEKVGIASIRFDFNGHGESEGNFQDMTVLNEIEDAKKIYDCASKISGVTSISIMGHSQGGVVASMVAGELGDKKIKSVALMAPAAVLRDNARAGEFFGKSYDAKNPPEYVEVFDNHKVGRNYILTAQTLPIYETAEKFQGSALIVHGTGDAIVPYGYGLRYKDIYKNSEIILLHGFDHGFNQNQEKAAQIVADFFAKTLK